MICLSDGRVRVIERSLFQQVFHLYMAHGPVDIALDLAVGSVKSVSIALISDRLVAPADGHGLAYWGNCCDAANRRMLFSSTIASGRITMNRPLNNSCRGTMVLISPA
jgi:hypothetical protein